MRWSVEVTSGEKTDLQKYVVDAESWQRALQAARAQRGEQGPMSGFSIELLDEGYRAVDPVTRNKFVVKRAPDDTPLTVPAAAPSATSGKDSKAPAAPRAMKAPAPLPSKTSVPPAANKSVPPAASKSIPPAAKSTPSVPPAAKSTPSVPPAAKSTPSVPPRPGDKKPEPAKKSRAERKSEKMKASAAKKAEERQKSAIPPPVVVESIEPEEEVPVTDAQPEPPRAPADSIQETPLLPVGAFVPGLPSVKLMTSREQDPSDASPLAYREYAFSTKEGTSEEVGEKILRAQLKLVQAHMEKLKQGKLVNLAVFDGTFEGKPTVPPLCTLAWKDWKGDPVIAFPRRSGAAKPVKPPTSPTASGSHSPVMPPTSMPPNPAPAVPSPVVNMPPGYSQPPPAASTTQPIQPSALPRPPGAIAAMVNAAKGPAAPEAAAAPPAEPNPLNQTVKDAVNPFAMSPSATPPANPFMPTPSAAPQGAPVNPFAPSPSAPPASAPVGPGTSPMIPAAAPVAAAPSVPPPAAPSTPPIAPPPAAGSFPPPAMGSVHPPATFQPQPPVPITTAPAQPSPQPRRASTPDGVVRTPSGRFVRGRVTGDELITELFESMHDLHFLRDALDGGQFCLALAMEMIPVRAAIIHFFDVEKREWIVACTRGKDAGKLLTTRTPETDDLLKAAARHRRAIVTPNGAHAQAQRYQSIGGARSIIIAPIMQAGRALGAMEMINPADGMPFNEDEGNAMTYIAEQYAEYLGSRGIVVHPDRIRAAANV